MPVPTVAVTSTQALVEAAGRRGVDVDNLLADHGVARCSLYDKEGRLPAPVVAAIWRDAAEHAREPELALWATVELAWGVYRVIDLLAASAATVGEALSLISRYFRIINDSVQIPIRARGG